jgi:hypothetical protein
VHGAESLLASASFLAEGKKIVLLGDLGDLSEHASGRLEYVLFIARSLLRSLDLKDVFPSRICPACRAKRAVKKSFFLATLAT